MRSKPLSVLAGLALAAGAFTTPAAAQEPGGLTIEPPVVADGDDFTVSGQCPEEAAGDQLPVLAGEAEEGEVLGHVEVAADGTFAGEATTPTTTPPSSGPIHVGCGVDGVSLVGQLTVVEAADLEAACPADARAADPFADVASDATHAEAISCLWVYGVASGRAGDDGLVYEPQSTVTREQMASFIATALDNVPDDVHALPDAHDGALYDDAGDIGAAHLPNVNRLTDAGILDGFADGTFRPGEPLDRAQMASFIAEAIEDVTGEELDRAPVFDDVSGVHQPNIEKLAAIGVTTGRADGTYGPDAPITRAQMASFLARSLGHLVGEGLLEPVAFDPGADVALLGLVDVDLGAHDGFDRVTLTLDGDDRDAGYRVQYVDEARSVGTGDPIDVEGDAILQITLTGMALPGDLPEDVEEALWEDGRATLDGDGIVEIVDDGVFEGQQQLFVGTTGLHPFEVERLDDPQRVYLDVIHTP